MTVRGPIPYDDELIGSVLARAAIWLALPPSTILRLMTGKSAGASYSLPIQVALLADSLALAPAELLQRHSMHPYAVAFTPTTTIAPRPYTGLRGSGRSIFFRACPECINYELLELGESYWHRSHMLPGVDACLIHTTKLLELNEGQPRTCANAMQVGLPHMCRLRANSAPHLPADYQRVWNSISFSTLTSEWRRRESWDAIYQERAASSGYVRADGKLASKLLGEDLTAALSAEFLASVGIEARTARSRT